MPSIATLQNFLDEKFQVIFKLFQFGIDKNSTVKMLEELRIILKDVPGDHAKFLELEDI